MVEHPRSLTHQIELHDWRAAMERTASSGQDNGPTTFDAAVDSLEPHMRGEISILGGTSRGEFGPKFGWSCPCQTFEQRNLFDEPYETREQARRALAAHFVAAILAGGDQ